jgi:carotenoid cleavage dioxygenase-like enzyme
LFNTQEEIPMSAEPTAFDNPFLEGLLAPIDDERNDVDLEIEGELPAQLDGMFIRNGPNPQFAPKGAYHPFDGDGMLHALYLEDGKARYRNRWIESAGLLAERKRGHACYGSISEFSATDADVIEEAGFMKNNANTHFVRHAGHYLALMEACKPTEVTRELETTGEYDFAGKLNSPMTAHPKIDPNTGELIFFGYSPIPPYLQYHVADANGKLVHSQVIDIPQPVMMHDFAVTERYTIFIDSPAIFDVAAMMSGEQGIRWEPERGTRLGVIPRFGQAEEIRWFEIDTAYVVHFFNAWDDGDKIEIHGPAFAEMPGGLQFDNPVQEQEPFPWRWVIDLAAGTVQAEQTDDQSGEFPRINDNVAGRRHRYMYNSVARHWGFGFDFNGVIKYDIESGKSQRFLHGDSEVSGEHVFAPDPNGSAEDDGWLLSVVTDRSNMQSALVVLDARDLDSAPVARVKIPRRVPIGFHANWLPGS